MSSVSLSIPASARAWRERPANPQALTFRSPVVRATDPALSTPVGHGATNTRAAVPAAVRPSERGATSR